MDSTEVEVRVRYAETDQIEEREVLLPVSRAVVDYRRPVRYDETVRVETWPDAVRSRSVTFRYALRRSPSGELLAEAETDLVCVDAGERIRRMPDDLRSLLERGVGGA